jgi:ectoine hydroxylase-related dioxygenase (phytanoyl-CoA dioxygenase family)
MFQLSEEQIHFYRENGFIQVDNLITPDELEELRTYANELMASEESVSHQPDKQNKAYNNVFNQRFNTWRDHGSMGKFTFHPLFASVAKQLAGCSAVRILHDHLLFKMPGDSKPTPWHQDLPYWPMDRPGALSLWIPLDDVDENNGCMMFVPGSHKYGKLTAIDLINPQNLLDFIDGGDEARNRPVIVRMKTGSATFHDGLTFHYAHPNHTNKPRRVLAIIYFPDGTLYNGEAHIIADYASPKLNTGEPIQGPLFPLID